MGVHTGDSITVAPALTLTDREYQRLRDIGIAIIREVGVDTGGCNIQFAVNPDDGRVIVIEMNPARLAVERAGLQGDRLPDRQDRREDGHRLHPRRGAQRHHPRDAGVLRADPRLRRRQGAAVRVREVPRRRPDADDDDEVGRRGDVDRPQLHRGAAEGAAVAGDARARRSTGTARRRTNRRGWPSSSSRPRSRPTAGSSPCSRRCAAARPSSRCTTATGIDPWFLDQIALINEVADARRGAPRSSRPALLRLAKRHGFSDAQIASLRRYAGGGGPRGASRPRGPPGLQDRRHLRGRVRGARRRTTTRTYDEENEVAPRERPGGDHPRLRAQPDRPGRRVRLLLRPRVVRVARQGLRHGHGQLQPRDGLDRLRHEQPALLRAAHPRGRPRGRPRRAARPGRSPASSSSSAGRPRSVSRRRSRTRACRSSAPAPRPSTSPRTAAPSAGSSREADLPAPKHGTAYSAEEAVEVAQRDRLPGPRPPVLRPRRPRHGDRLRRRDAGHLRHPRDHRQPEHPVLVDRFLDDAIEIDVDALYDGEEMYLGGIMEHIEEAGIHSGDSSCTLPPVTLGRTRARAGPRVDAQARRGHRRPRADERAVRPGPGHPLRPRGQPARVAHRAVRGQGHRGPIAKAAARVMLGATIKELREEGMLPAARATAAGCRTTRRCRSRRRCCRSSGSAPARAWSSTRCSARRCARPARSWASTSTSGRRSPRARWAAVGAAGQRGGVRLGRQPRQAGDDLPGQAPGRPRLHHPRDQRHRGGAAAQRDRGDGGPQDHASASPRSRASRRSSTSSTTARWRWSSTRRPGQAARADGYEIRAATTAPDKPIITTVAGARRRGAGHRGPAQPGRSGSSRCRTTPATSTSTAGARRSRDRRRPSRMSERRLRAGVVQVAGEVIATRRVGAYQHLTFVAPGVAELARPGQFVALAVGGDTSANLLRRCFSIHKVSPSGTYGGTVDIVVAAARARHDVDHPAARRTTRSTSSARSASRSRCRTSRCLRAGRRRLRQRPAVLAGRASCASAAATSRWCSARRARTGCSASSRRGARPTGVTVTTDDGSAGTRGWVSDVLPRGHPAAAGPASSTAAGRWAMLELDHRGRRRRRAPWRRSRSRSRWPAASASA